MDDFGGQKQSAGDRQIFQHRELHDQCPWNDRDRKAQPIARAGFCECRLLAVQDFSIRDRTRLQLRGEFFNLSNHTQLLNPTATVTSPTFGVITSARAPRIVQVALRLSF